MRGTGGGRPAVLGHGHRAAFPRRLDLDAPFAVAAVEQGTGVAATQPQHRAQVVCLIGTDAEREVDVIGQTRGTVEQNRLASDEHEADVTGAQRPGQAGDQTLNVRGWGRGH